MKAKSKRRSSAFAARIGTCRSIAPLVPSAALFARGGAPEVPRVLPGGRGTLLRPASEAGRDAPEAQLVAALDALAVDGRAVEEGAVGRAQVLDDEAVLRARELGVTAG